MRHTVAGSNFHGGYEVRLDGPAEGFDLSESQLRKVLHERCPHSDCMCGGSLQYGEGPRWGTSRVIRQWLWNRIVYRLLPPSFEKTALDLIQEEGDVDIIA